MNLFVYEWVCGGGFLGRADSPPTSLEEEGWAMLSALLDDFVGVEDVEVMTLVEEQYVPRMNGHWACMCPTSAESRELDFDHLAEQADATLLIAPEFEGILLRLANRVVEVGGTLLSASPDLIAIASDKQSTAERLHAERVDTPRGTVLMPGERCPLGFTTPALIKPIDGCGSGGVRMIDQGEVVPGNSPAFRLEEFVEGTPASVLCLCGENQVVALEPCEQRIAGDGDFSYLGGTLPLEDELRTRATRLATTAIEALPAPVGFVGVDMVLGDANDRSRDVVIEINPRLTTSYVGLRAATNANLAECMLALARGETRQPPEFEQPLSWTASGKITLL